MAHPRASYRAIAIGVALCAALVNPAWADGDAKKGAKAFKRCRTCHTVTEETNKSGPHLVGIIDRRIASLDFKYSDPKKEFAGEDGVWDVETLKIYLKKPRASVKGTTMGFAGLKKDADIDDIIAYLRDPAAAE